MRFAASAAVLAVLLFVASGARAQTCGSLDPELSIGAGYNDNLFLDPALTGATTPRGDAIIDVRPSLTGALVHRGHAWTLGGDYLERITPSNGDIRDLLLRGEWRSPVWHRLKLSLAALYEHYETTRFADNTFDLGGGEVALRVIVARAAWLQAAYRADARGYSDPSRNEQLDVSQRAVVSAELRPHASVSLVPSYQLLDVVSNEPTAALLRHRGELRVEWRPTSWLTAEVAYALFWQALPHGAPPTSPVQPGGPRHDWAHAASAVLAAHPRRWLELFARYDLLVSTSNEPTGRYRLDQVVAGAALSWTLTYERAPAPPPLAPVVRGGEVTFRARARPGARVGVVGDWNQWQAQPLAPLAGDRYEATLTLPPGRHAWALEIDGALVTPPEASGFVDDGFGGKNAVVDVP